LLGMTEQQMRQEVVDTMQLFMKLQTRVSDERLRTSLDTLSQSSVDYVKHHDNPIGRVLLTASFRAALHDSLDRSGELLQEL
jgi:hypothetical protein